MNKKGRKNNRATANCCPYIRTVSKKRRPITATTKYLFDGKVQHWSLPDNEIIFEKITWCKCLNHPEK